MAVVGLLELLWHFANKYAPQGNIGRWTDANIAQGVHWDREPAELIDALVANRFLDSSKEHRLIVHDWHDHADDSTRKSLSRNGLDFLTRPSKARTSRDKSRHVETSPEQESGHVETKPENGGLPLPLLSSPFLSSPSPDNGNDLPASPGVLRPARIVAKCWSAEACDDWNERFGDGTAHGGKIGRELKPLVDRYGWPAVRDAWRNYLGGKKATFANPADFRSKYGEWVSDQASAGATDEEPF